MRLRGWTILSVAVLLPSTAAMPTPTVPLQGDLWWKAWGHADGILTPGAGSVPVAALAPMDGRIVDVGSTSQAELILHRWFQSSPSSDLNVVDIPLQRADTDVHVTKTGVFNDPLMVIEGIDAAPFRVDGAHCAINPRASPHILFPTPAQPVGPAWHPAEAAPGSLDATCSPGAFAGEARAVFYFGVGLHLQGAHTDCDVWTGMREGGLRMAPDPCEAVGRLPASEDARHGSMFMGNVVQILEVRTNGAPISLDLPASPVVLSAPTLIAVGTLDLPASTGALSWGARRDEGDLDPAPILGIFQMHAAGQRNVEVSGRTVDGPTALGTTRTTLPAARGTPALLAGGLGLAMLGLAAFLFSKLSKGAVLDHPRRAAILEIVKREPGVETNAVARALGIRWPKAAYHVERLERAGELVVRRIGGRTALFPANGGHRGREQGIVLQRRETPRRALDALRATPDLDQAGLASALGLHQSQASRVLSALREAGLIQAVYVAGRTRYRALDSPAPTPTAPATAIKPQEPF